jgi:hypothetical protein
LTQNNYKTRSGKKTRKKKKTEKPNREKKLIKPIRIFKKPTSLVRFWFYKFETEKTELNPNWKKPSQTGTGRFEPVFVLK